MSTYDPELFPGIRIVIQPPDEVDFEGKQLSLRALVFSSGNCVLTGAKTRHEIVAGWTAVQQVVKPYLNLQMVASADLSDFSTDNLESINADL